MIQALLRTGRHWRSVCLQMSGGQFSLVRTGEHWISVSGRHWTSVCYRQAAHSHGVNNCHLTQSSEDNRRRSSDDWPDIGLNGTEEKRIYNKININKRRMDLSAQTWGELGTLSTHKLPANRKILKQNEFFVNKSNSLMIRSTAKQALQVRRTNVFWSRKIISEHDYQRRTS